MLFDISCCYFILILLVVSITALETLCLIASKGVNRFNDLKDLGKVLATTIL